jgi:hypothetical protein
VRLLAVHLYLELIVESPDSKMDSSRQIEREMYKGSSEENKARLVRKWAGRTFASLAFLGFGP